MFVVFRSFISLLDDGPVTIDIDREHDPIYEELEGNARYFNMISYN